MESRFWTKNYDYSVPATIRYTKIPIQEFVNLAAAFHPQKAATDFYGSLITFREMRIKILRMANALVGLGVRKGDRVGIALPNCPQYVIAGGFNIYPREVDEVLYQHPKMAEAMTVGIPDEYRGETGKVFVVLHEGQTATADEIIAFCKEKLVAYKVPKLVEFRDAIPKSAVGKILRKILRNEEIAKMKK